MPAFRLLPLALLAFTVALVRSPAADPPKVESKFKLSKDTSFITGPLKADGYLDYETALNDRLRGKTTPKTNAVARLAQALGPKPQGGELHADFWKALGIETPPADGAYLFSHYKFFEDELRGEDAQAFNDRESQLRKMPWKATDEPKQAEYLKANEKPLAVAVEASKLPDYFHPYISRPGDGSPGMLIGALLPMPQKVREVAAALTLRAMLRCGEGKFDDAWADILAVHRLGRLISKGGSAIEMLVGIALGAIAHQTEQAFLAAAKLDAKQALKCQADLLALPKWGSYADRLDLGERFTALDALQSIRRGGADQLVFGGERKKLTPAEIDAAMAKLDWDVMFKLLTTWYGKFVDAARKPTRAERVKAGVEIDEALKKLMGEQRELGDIAKLVEQANEEKVRTAVSEKIAVVLLGLVAPALAKVGDAADRAEQTSRNGVLAFALAAYHADQKKYPEKLADLVPKYLPKLHDDLFTDKPLIYKRADAGYLLYSVGVNGKDEGGQSFGDDPKGDDLVVRVPRK